MDHFNTGEGWPQSRAEVEALSAEDIFEFMGCCAEEPADPDDCLACYAYMYSTQEKVEAAEITLAERLAARSNHVLVPRDDLEMILAAVQIPQLAKHDPKLVVVAEAWERLSKCL